HQANEVLLTFAKTGESAVMFPRRTLQRNYLGFFTVAFGTAWTCTHGGLLLRNCHSLIVVCCVIPPSDYRRATMAQSHSRPLNVQPVQRVGAIMLKYIFRSRHVPALAECVHAAAFS